MQAMERCVLAIAILLVSGFVSAQVSEQLRGQLEDCRLSFNVSEEEVKRITEKQTPSSGEAKCYLHCIFSKMGVMTEEGKMNTEGMKGFIREIPKMDEEDLKKLELVADKCGRTPLFEDPCENSVLVYDCINVESDELGVKGP